MSTDDTQTENLDIPLISAVMLIGKLPVEQVQLAINCFADQTYPNKELIIVNNASNQWQASALQLTLPVDPISQQPIAHILDTEYKLTAGMSRNYGLSVAKGSIIIQFDADCWHSSHRIATQVTAMVEHQAQVCMLSRGLEYGYNGYTTYWSNSKRILPNTMIFFKPQDNYPNVEKSEELGLLNKLMQSGYKPIALDKPELVCKLHFTAYSSTTEPVIYPDNLLSKEHFQQVHEIVKLRLFK